MALTRNFIEIVKARAERDPEFRVGLLDPNKYSFNYFVYDLTYIQAKETDKLSYMSHHKFLTEYS